MRQYVVQPGDSPASVAAEHAGCPKCSRDLVKSNPHKQSVIYPNGFLSFQTFAPGETINLPDKWFSPEFDALPFAYFAALPSADGVTPSKLGVAAAGVLGDYATLDSATTHVADLARLNDLEFSTASAAAAAEISQSVREVISSSNKDAAGNAQDAQASAYWVKGRAQQMGAAVEAGDSVAAAAARPQIQSVLATGLDSARAALQGFHSSHTPPSIPVTTASLAAVQALLTLDPCAASSAAAVCAAQSSLGVFPDGKYGDSTAAAARVVASSAPRGCNPRPAWWSPAGSKNCPGPASAPPTQLPPFPAVTPPEKGLSVASVIGVGVIGAGLVGGAIYLALNPKVLERSPVSQRPTRHY